MQMVDNERIVGVDIINEIHTFVYSSHAVHTDLRGLTGGVTTFGTGILSGKSS